jgi:hypothetical protein
LFSIKKILQLDFAKKILKVTCTVIGVDLMITTQLPR